MTAQTVREAALVVGFDACGVIPLKPVESAVQSRLCSWLLGGFHAGMSFMERYLDIRADPRLMVKGARTAIVLLYSYKPAQPQPSHLPQVSAYAYGLDYHTVLKQQMTALRDVLRRKNPMFSCRSFVDTAPLHERYLAVRAGLGWIGKNGMLVNRELGPQTFIAVMLTGTDVRSDAHPAPNLCGSCRLCLQACPSQALLDNGLLDSRRCFSYRTIEAHRAVNPHISPVNATPRYIFGCDICQNICPYSASVKPRNHHDMQLLPPLTTLTATDWQDMATAQFEQLFASSAILRAGVEGMKKNVEDLRI
jgi:epoxyqueuosine reductase